MAKDEVQDLALGCIPRRRWNWLTSWFSFIITAVGYLAAIVGVLSWQYEFSKGEGKTELQFISCGEYIGSFGFVRNRWTENYPANMTESICATAAADNKKFLSENILKWFEDAWILSYFSIAFFSLGVGLTFASFGHDFYLLKFHDPKGSKYNCVVKSQRGKVRGCNRCTDFVSIWSNMIILLGFMIGWFVFIMYLVLDGVILRGVLIFFPFMAIVAWLSWDVRGSTYTSIALAVLLGLVSLGGALVALTSTSFVEFKLLPPNANPGDPLGSCICGWNVGFTSRIPGIFGYVLLCATAISNAFSWLGMMAAGRKDRAYCDKFQTGTGLFFLHFSTKIPYEMYLKHHDFGIKDIYEEILLDLEAAKENPMKDISKEPPSKIPRVNSTAHPKDSESKSQTSDSSSS